MVQTEKILVIGFRKVGPFTDEKTGEIIDGMNVFYLSDRESKDDNEIGHIPGKRWVQKGHQSYAHVESSGTGWYNMNLDLVLTGTKPKINFLNFEFLEEHELFAS